MIRFQNRISVNRPAEEVFEFLSEFENIPKWNYYVRSVGKVSDGPTGKGTVYHQVRRDDSQTFEIVEYHPHTSVSVKTRPAACSDIILAMKAMTGDRKRRLRGIMPRLCS